VAVTTFTLFFALMFANYGLNAINFRMIARGSYLGTAWSDAAIAVLGFTLIRQVAETDAVVAQAGYVCGGVCGSMVGLWLTRHRGE
jgi:hypothetical protein